MKHITFLNLQPPTLRSQSLSSNTCKHIRWSHASQGPLYTLWQNKEWGRWKTHYVFKTVHSPTQIRLPQVLVHLVIFLGFAKPEITDNKESRAMQELHRIAVSGRLQELMKIDSSSIHRGICELLAALKGEDPDVDKCDRTFAALGHLAELGYLEGLGKTNQRALQEAICHLISVLKNKGACSLSYLYVLSCLGFLSRRGVFKDLSKERKNLFQQSLRDVISVFKAEKLPVQQNSNVLWSLGKIAEQGLLSDLNHEDRHLLHGTVRGLVSVAKDQNPNAEQCCEILQGLVELLKSINLESPLTLQREGFEECFGVSNLDQSICVLTSAFDAQKATVKQRIQMLLNLSLFVAFGHLKTLKNKDQRVLRKSILDLLSHLSCEALDLDMAQCADVLWGMGELTASDSLQGLSEMDRYSLRRNVHNLTAACVYKSPCSVSYSNIFRGLSQLARGGYLQGLPNEDQGSFQGSVCHLLSATIKATNPNAVSCSHVLEGLGWLSAHGCLAKLEEMHRCVLQDGVCSLLSSFQKQHPNEVLCPTALRGLGLFVEAGYLKTTLRKESSSGCYL